MNKCETKTIKNLLPFSLEQNKNKERRGKKLQTVLEPKKKIIIIK